MYYYSLETTLLSVTKALAVFNALKAEVAVTRTIFTAFLCNLKLFQVEHSGFERILRGELSLQKNCIRKST